jgi:hypothetical protein
MTWLEAYSYSTVLDGASKGTILSPPQFHTLPRPFLRSLNVFRSMLLACSDPYYPAGSWSESFELPGLHCIV